MKLAWIALGIVAMFNLLVCLNAQESNEDANYNEAFQFNTDPQKGAAQNQKNSSTGESNLPEHEQEGSVLDQLHEVNDGAYKRVTAIEREALKPPEIREADVHWSKRVWREVDGREKLNYHFIYQEEPLIKVLMSIMEDNPDQVLAYADEKFTESLTYKDIEAKLRMRDTIEVLDPDTYEYTQVLVENDLNFDEFIKFRFKEDWIFDTRDSRMHARIIGICPVRDVYDDWDNFRGQEALFWIHYPSMRDYLVKFEAFNPYNDALSLSWTDVLDMRYFNGLITKENNAFGRRIEDYVSGRDRIYESNKIKEEIMNYEFDAWSY